MTTNTTITGFTRFLLDLAVIAEKEASRIEQTALLTGLSDMKRRIFNDGKDSSDAPIGKKARRKPSDRFVGDYEASYYEQVRGKRGAGKKKNLNIDGSHLRNNMQIGKAGSLNTFGFINEESAVIGVGQEDIHEKQIFDPTDAEIDDMIDDYVDGIFDLIEKSLRKIAA